MLRITGTGRTDAGGAGTAGRLLIRQRQGAFVGRAAVLEQLVAAAAATQTDGPVVRWLVGEAGIGKTRLAAELAARLQESGTAVLYGRADDRLALPFGAFLEAIDAGLSTLDPRDLAQRLAPHTGSLARLLPSLAGLAGPNAIDAAPGDLGRAIEHALAVISARHGALLVLDDMQWATQAELRLIETLAAGLAGTALLVLVLHRKDSEPDASRMPDGGQVQKGPPDRIALEPFDLDEVAALILKDSRSGERAQTDGLSREVWRMSGGNPLLASELLRSALHGENRRRGVLDVLVHERLELLPAAAPSVLATGAVAGLEFDPRLVAAASTADTTEALAILEEALRIGLLVPAIKDARWLAFRHGLVRGSLLQMLEPAERMRLHHRLGSVLERESSTDPAVPASLALHFGASASLGDWRRALDYSMPVARAALDAGVYEDVVAVATRTLAILDSREDPDRLARLDLEILLGGGLRGLAEPRAFEVLHQAFEEALELGDGVRAADAALAFSAYGAASEEGFLDDSLMEVYERATAALGDQDPQRRARLLGHLATAHAWRLDGATGRRLADEALTLARAGGDSATLGRVLITIRRLLAGSPRLDERDAIEAELLALGDELDEPGLKTAGALWRLETRIEQCQGAELEEWLAVAEINAGTLRLGSYHHTLAYMQAAVALLRGDADEADVLVERAADIGRSLGLSPMIVEAIRWIQLIGVRHEQGRLHELGDEPESFFTAAGVGEWLGAIAFIDAEMGELARARANLDEFFTRFNASGAVMSTPLGFAAHMAAPIAATSDHERAAVLYPLLAPHAGTGTFFAYFAGPIDYHLGLLAGTLGRHDDAARHFTAAADACLRLGAPSWLARANSALAST
jgi:hypothetical protein